MLLLLLICIWTFFPVSTPSAITHIWYQERSWETRNTNWWSSRPNPVTVRPSLSLEWTASQVDGKTRKTTAIIWLPSFYIGVSKNSGTPKSSILIGFSLINHPFWGTPIFGNTHMAWKSKFDVCFIFVPQLTSSDRSPQCRHQLEA